MTKPNRALKAIDKNSLPKIIDILEIPKAGSSKAAKDVSKSEVTRENAGPIPIRPRKRRKKTLALSKTPKISNLGGNKNVTTRRGLLATNSRPPMPNSFGSATKKRRGLGVSVLTPYGAQVARLKSRSGGITPSLSKSPNLKKHYDRLKPIACNLYNQHTKQHQQVGRSKTLLGRISGRNSQDQKTTINSTPSMNRTPNTTMTKLPTTPSKKGGDEKKTIPKETTNELKTNPNENRNHFDSDDMDCDSSDELSLNSSSSSSPSPSKKTEPSSSLTPTNEEQPRNSFGVQNHFELDSERRYKIMKKSGHDETNANPSPDFDDAATTHLSVSISPSNANGDKADQKRLTGTKQEFVSTCTNDSNRIEDIKVFNLVMGNHDNELLGTTVGGSRFYWNNIDEDSVLTSVSSNGDHKSSSIVPSRNTKRVVFQTPNAPFHTESSPPIENDQNKQQKISPQRHYYSNELPEEESIEAWSIDGHRNSPFFFDIGGKKYGHPPLPPGWTMRISRGENRPVYSHPDHGRTWHCPIKLTPNMVYVKTSDGRFVKQIRNSLESLKTDTNSPKRAHHRRETPKTPPSAREVHRFESDNRHVVSQTNRMKDNNGAEIRQEDQDSTAELMKEISVLSAGLMKKSSSNLQKVEKVKTIHHNTSALSKYDVFSCAKTVQSNTKRMGLLSSQDSRSKMLVSSTSQSTTSQHHEKETPSTMSALLQQYEHSLGHCDNLANASQSHSDSSKKNSVVNDLGKVLEAKKLSPITESKNSERIEAWFTPAEGMTQGNSNDQVALLKFGSKKKEMKQNKKGSSEEKLSGNKTSPEATSDSSLANSLQKSVKDSPIQYDDEWSPLAQPESTSESLPSTPESPLRNDYKSSGVTAVPEKKVKPNDSIGMSKRKESIDRIPASEAVARSILAVDETKAMPKEKSEGYSDTESSGTLSTKSPSGLQDKTPNVSAITISVQAHRSRNKSPKLIDLGVTVPLRQKEDQFDGDHCSEVSDVVQSITRTPSNKSHDGGTKDDNTPKAGSQPGSGTETDEKESNLSGGRLHPDPKADELQTDFEDEQSVCSEKQEGENTPDKTDTSDDGFVHDGESLSNGPVDLLADDDSDTTTSTTTSIPQPINQYDSPTIDENAQGRTSTGTPFFFSAASETLSRSIEDGIPSSGTESAIESSVQRIDLDQCDSHDFPDVENCDSSIESPGATTKFVSKKNSSRDLNSSSFIQRKRNGMSWRVLNPPHPLCSLQRLEELVFLETKRKKSRAKRPKRGGRTQRKNVSAARRRKSKGTARN